MQIRAYLFLMAAGILIPVIVFSGLALNMLQGAEKTAALRGLNETARGVALLVDRELYSAEAALRVLAASPALARGDMGEFYREAKTADRGATSWTLLQDAKGNLLVNTYLPFGSALPQAFNAPLVQRVMASRQTTVSDLLNGPASKRLITTVDVPVPLDGGQRHVLSMALSTDHFNQLITLPNVPQGWLIAIIDDKGRFIARTRKAAELVGKPFARARGKRAARGAACRRPSAGARPGLPQEYRARTPGAA